MQRGPHRYIFLVVVVDDFLVLAVILEVLGFVENSKGKCPCLNLRPFSKLNILCF